MNMTILKQFKALPDTTQRRLICAFLGLSISFLAFAITLFLKT